MSASFKPKPWWRAVTGAAGAGLALSTSLESAEPAAYIFTPSAKEAELYVRIRDDAAQQRVQVVMDPRLSTAARKHAEDTQRRKFFAHRNPDGVNPNQRVLNEGYPLPPEYAANQNYVESMAGSVVDTPADALSLWRKSTEHATHVFAKNDFYRGQVVLGVGHAPASRLGYATYVFISAPGPVGQNWSVTRQTMAKATIAIESDGAVSISRLQPQSILEVWKSGSTISSWSMQHTFVADSGGSAAIGDKSGARGFFRLGYFQR